MERILFLLPETLARLIFPAFVSFFHDHLPYLFLVEVEKFVDELEVKGSALWRRAGEGKGFFLR